MENVIEIKNLVKKYKDVLAVDDLSIKVKKGELYAFLGVNGAGKSTTISVICGSLEKTSGSVTVLGENVDTDIDKIVAKTGVVFQNSALDKVLTVKENLAYKAAMYGLNKTRTDEKIEELASLLDFKDYLNRPFGKLSGGQARRIDVARALIHDPELLILDEPTTGLDPQTRKTLWKVIEAYRKNKGLTVFLTTHYMEEAADADYVVILDKGKISAEGTPLDLKNKYTGDYITVYGDKEGVIKNLGVKYEKLPSAVRIEVKDTAAARDLIIAHPEVFDDFELVKGKMDDVFLAVTGKKLSAGGEL